MRILHAARNPADQAGVVVRALRRLGHDAQVWVYDQNPFGYQVDREIDIHSGDPSIWWRTFEEAITGFDVVHFHFGRSLFPEDWGGVPALWDLPIYRILGLKVFATWHGTDCRLRAVHLDRNPWSYYRYSDLPADDDRTTKVLEVFRTYADRQFVTAPDYLDYVPDAEVLGRLIDLADWPERAPEQRAEPAILHVPSRRGTKGTELLLPAIERLRQEGLAFEFQLLEGVPHDEARRAIQRADIVIDNLITGDYELVSIEAMASSRVAVANIQGPSAEAFPGAPVWSVDPDTVVDRLRALITDIDVRRQLAARGRDHVTRFHDATVGATKLLAAYEAPSRPVSRESFPDWVSLAPRRRIEHLERQLAAARSRELGYRRRLGLPVDVRDERSLKDRLPMPLRLALRRLRARLTEAMRRRR